jgi:transcription elongation factor Elf1
MLAASTWLDEKYVNLLSFRLDRFKRVNKSLYNFRCPLCGDSTKSKTKARGYVFEHKGAYWFKCHNCARSTRFKYLLKEIDQSLYDQYNVEWLQDQGQSRFSAEPTVPKFVPMTEKFGRQRKDKSDPLKVLKKVSQLKPDHKAKKYVESRKIPPNMHHLLYWCPAFYAWANHYIPGKFDENALAKDEGRLVIPFIDANGYVVGATGRSLNKDAKLRYVSIKFQEDSLKVFGLERVDFNREGYVVEGPIDSLFLPNCIAMAGSSGDLSSLPLKNKFIFIFDNEPRNKEIVKLIESVVEDGKRVCLFENVKEKDINDLIMSGMSVAEIIDLIHRSTHQGLQAKLTLQRWKKI